jgi:hypothetical protein
MNHFSGFQWEMGLLISLKNINMNIRELIKKAFNKDLPISGGMGNSIEEAVILESAGPLNDYVSLQYQVMDLISMGRDVSWELKGQELIVRDGRKYDKLMVAGRASVEIPCHCK